MSIYLLQKRVVYLTNNYWYSSDCINRYKVRFGGRVTTGGCSNGISQGG